ncbi:hypothetical protein V1478_003565, partial [Vespula squamosa]
MVLMFYVYSIMDIRVSLKGIEFHMKGSILYRTETDKIRRPEKPKLKIAKMWMSFSLSKLATKNCLPVRKEDIKDKGEARSKANK